MSKCTLSRTDTADAHIHKLILSIAEKYGADTALDKLNQLESQIKILEENPYIGATPRYMILRRQGYRILITDKNLIFYKINEAHREITIYAVIDQRQDYLSIIQGL